MSRFIFFNYSSHQIDTMSDHKFCNWSCVWKWNWKQVHFNRRIHINLICSNAKCSDAKEPATGLDNFFCELCLGANSEKVYLTDFFRRSDSESDPEIVSISVYPCSFSNFKKQDELPSSSKIFIFSLGNDVDLLINRNVSRGRNSGGALMNIRWMMIFYTGCEDNWFHRLKFYHLPVKTTILCWFSSFESLNVRSILSFTLPLPQ